MSATSPAKAQYTVPDTRELEQFLFHEARLLDEQRWQEWGDLFVENGEYWVPATPGQEDPHNHISLMYETDLLRAVRIKRFRHPNAFSLKPMPRSSHIISNVMLDEFDEAQGVSVVTSRFIMLHYRREEQDILGGACTHKLQADNDSFKILSKKVELVNCDAPMGNILVYL